VVLPAASYAEKDGTFTNTEGLVQPVRRAIDPVGESRPDWEILSALSVLMGYPIEYGEAKEIFKEIRSVIPVYALLGPVPTAPKPSTAVVSQYIQGGYADDLATRYRAPGRKQGARGEGLEKMFTLVLSQSLFHSGKLSTRAKGLLEVEADGKLALNSLDAGKLHLAEGDRVRVTNERGEMTTTVALRDRLPEGLVTFPEHFDEQALSMMPLAIDDQTGVPYYRAARVKIERVP
jgi:formate dehydrogenase alpha subunit